MDDVARLESIAQQLAARIRDDDPEANGRWLAAELPDPGDWFRLCFALAQAVPDDRTWRQLTAWTRAPEPTPTTRLSQSTTIEQHMRREALVEASHDGYMRGAKRRQARRAA